MGQWKEVVEGSGGDGGGEGEGEQCRGRWRWRWHYLLQLTSQTTCPHSAPTESRARRDYVYSANVSACVCVRLHVYMLCQAEGLLSDRALDTAHTCERSRKRWSDDLMCGSLEHVLHRGLWYSSRQGEEVLDDKLCVHTSHTHPSTPPTPTPTLSPTPTHPPTHLHLPHP